jgi:hypothetical protein
MVAMDSWQADELYDDMRGPAGIIVSLAEELF